MIVDEQLNGSLYDHFKNNSDAKICKPLYVKESLNKNNLDPLLMMLFRVFEVKTWQFFKKNITYKGALIYGNDTTTNSTDHEIQHNHTDIINRRKQQHNVNFQLKISQVNDTMCEIIYYIAGFSFNYALHTLDNNNDDECKA